jgi:hypothetical protein
MNPGCWQVVAAMIQGLLLLWGPTVLPFIGPSRVNIVSPEAGPATSTAANATPQSSLII